MWGSPKWGFFCPYLAIELCPDIAVDKSVNTDTVTTDTEILSVAGSWKRLNGMIFCVELYTLKSDDVCYLTTTQTESFQGITKLSLAL